jgi:cation diffusion facilitator CzcD-associated flavoprotein CzcO
MQSDPQTAGDHHRVVIIGAGFAGIGMAVRLRQQGIDFLILEGQEDLGGTWLVNTYPGCQCDVPSVLYSLSFAPNPNWTRSFAPQGEIEEYVRSVADRFDIKRSIRFGHWVNSARWDTGDRRWALDTPHGTVTADVVVLGTGGLSSPALPDIPGIASFQGTLFHSARWRHDHQLSGERVAVIGTGASSIQLVPQIQPEVEQLLVFQRTAPWVLPRRDRPFSRWERTLYRRVPLAQRLVRAAIYWGRELLVVPMAKYPRLLQRAERGARRYLAASVADPELRSKVTPHFTLGCKRILLSNDYLPALNQPNVEVVTDGIGKILPHAIVTVTGREHPVDTIILGTGFEVSQPPIASVVHGADGRSLQEHWADGGMRAYLGTTIPGFPNLFFLTGPNTGLGHTSMIFMMESHFNYVIDALRTMDAGRLATVEVRPEVLAAYDGELQAKLSRSVWNTGGCSSWYLDASGRNTTLWPDFTWQFRQRTRRFDVDRYTVSR